PDGTFVAPLYDLATGLTYDTNSPGGDRRVALSIGGRRTFGQVLPKHWDRAADEIGLSREWIRERVHEMAEQFPDAFSDACQAIDAPEAAGVLTRTRARLAAHCADIVDRFDRDSRAGGTPPE